MKDFDISGGVKESQPNEDLRSSIDDSPSLLKISHRESQEGSAAVMAVTAAPHGRNRDAWIPSEGDNAGSWQVKELFGKRFGLVYSRATTISFSRTMFSRLRAALSIARGSLSRWLTSSRKA